MTTNVSTTHTVVGYIIIYKIILKNDNKDTLEYHTIDANEFKVYNPSN